MLSDIEIAQQAQLRPINQVAAELGLTEDHVEPYGKYKAKIDFKIDKEKIVKSNRIAVQVI